MFTYYSSRFAETTAKGYLTIVHSTEQIALLTAVEKGDCFVYYPLFVYRVSLIDLRPLPHPL